MRLAAFLKRTLRLDDSASNARTTAWATLRTSLEVVKEAADGVPLIGLKGAIGGVLAVIKIVEASTADENLEDIKTLTRHLKRLEDLVIKPLMEAAADNPSFMTPALESLIDDLENELIVIKTTAENQKTRGLFQRLVYSSDDVAVIRRINQGMDRALHAFQAGTVIELLTRFEDTRQVVVSTKNSVSDARAGIVSTQIEIGRTRQDLHNARDYIVERVNDTHEVSALTQHEVGQTRMEVAAISKQVDSTSRDVSLVRKSMAISITVALTKAQDDLIRGLPRAHDARHDSGVRHVGGPLGCLPATRESTLNTIYAWLRDPDSGQPSIFWIWGMAGTGKSAIAQSVAVHEAALNRLGASFFFSRDRAQQKDPLLLFPTIAFQLATFDPRYKRHLAEALEETPSAPYAHIQEQLSSLIVKPLLACGPRTAPFLIVIDALDECDPESEAEKIIRVWAAELPKLKGVLKILVTSRPEFRIRGRYQSSHLDSLSQSYILHDIDATVVEEDIKRYLTHHLKAIAEDYRLEVGWIDGKSVETLAGHAGAFFIVAATAIKFIGDTEWNDPRHQLQVLVDEGATQSLDAVGTLYVKVVGKAVASGDPKLLDRFRRVVGTIVLLQDPMSATSLGTFLGEDPGTIRSTLSRLHSLIIVPDDPDTPIRVFHKSFSDLISGRVPCPDSRLQIDPATGHARLAALCFKHLSLLQRGAYASTSVRPPYSDAFGFQLPFIRVPSLIPHHIRYACIYVASHVANSPPGGTELPALLLAFCESSVLVWIELLSRTEQLDVAVPALRALRQWYLSTHSPTNRVQILLQDAERLVRQSFDVIKSEGGHVYTSALFWAPDCALRTHYTTDRQPLCFGGRYGKHWTPCVSVMEGKVGDVRGLIFFSPDNSLIAAPARIENRSYAGIWSAVTGGSKLHVLGVHTTPSVKTVAFSADGGRLAGCCEDQTVRIWDITTGLLLHTLTPLHNMQRVSEDVRPLPATLDSGAHTPMQQHAPPPPPSLLPNPSMSPEPESRIPSTREIEVSVNFRPTSAPQELLSISTNSNAWTERGPGGSKSTSVEFFRKLEERSGQHEFHSGTTLAHTSIIVFSPDGLHLAVLGAEGSLHLWDAVTGELQSTREAAGTRATSVAFARSGAVIASGSNDSKVHLWELTGGAPFGTMSVGLKAVTQVVFTSSDTHIMVVSGNTVQKWDTTTLMLVESQEMTEATELVLSPDGKLGACWSTAQADPDIDIIDISEKSKLGTTPHTGRIAALGFSPDGAQFAAVSEYRILTLYDIDAIKQSYLQKTSPSENAKCTVLAFNGTHLVTDLSGTSRIVWDIRSHAVVAETDDGAMEKGWELSVDGTCLLSYPKTAEGTRSSPASTGGALHSPKSPIADSENTGNGAWIIPGARVDGSERRRTFELCVWDPTTLKRQRSMPLLAPPNGSCISTSGKLFAVGEAPDNHQDPSFITVFERQSGVAIFRAAATENAQEILATMAFSFEDTHLVACVGKEAPHTSRIHSWNIRTSTRITSAFVDSCPRDRNCQLLVLPGEKIAHRGDTGTLLFGVETLAVVGKWRHPKNSLVQVRPDGNLAFLEIRDEWLYFFTRTHEWRLCWLPVQWRTPFGIQAYSEWKQRYLTMANWDGAVVALHVDELKDRATRWNRPTQRDASPASSLNAPIHFPDSERMDREIWRQQREYEAYMQRDRRTQSAKCVIS